MFEIRKKEIFATGPPKRTLKQHQPRKWSTEKSITARGAALDELRQ